nr:ArsC family reductase [Marinibactrum halimedae]
MFGIKNCDTVKKARSWLEEHDIEYTYHDIRLDGLKLPQVQEWINELGWEQIVNKRSTTWKQLNDTQRNNINNTSAPSIIIANPTLVRRPVLDTGTTRHTGFKADYYAEIFGK